MLGHRLRTGDTIGLVAPSNPFTEKSEASIAKAKEFIVAQGFHVVAGRNLRKVDSFFASAGTPEERAKDINGFFKDASVDAVWCVWDGKSANQVLDLLDYASIKKHPKPFLGMSDVDVLHLAINKMTCLVTFNAPDFKIGDGLHLEFIYSQKAFRERLVERNVGEIMPAKKRVCLRKGKASGKILGCNLSCILKLAGTRYFPDFRDSILFLEAYNDTSGEVLQRLSQLDQIGIFKKIKGIVVGYAFSFDDGEAKKDKKGVLFEDMVLDVTKKYSFPIMQVYDFGHRCGNCFLPIGGEARIDAEKLSVEISKPCLL